MSDNTIDGTPDAVKAACPVWSGGKSGDNFKGLPITIGGDAAVLRPYRVYPLRGPGGGTEFLHSYRDDKQYGSSGGRRGIQKRR